MLISECHKLENNASNTSAFSRNRKDASDGTALREFYARAAATGNARSLSVERRVDGTGATRHRKGSTVRVRVRVSVRVRIRVRATADLCDGEPEPFD